MTLVLAFGSHTDPQAWKMSDKLKEELPEAEFRKTENPQDILEARGDVVVLDVVKGLDKPRYVSIKELKERSLFTAHDFDLGFLLKILDESGMISTLLIIGIPEEWNEDTVKEVRDLLRS